MLFLRCICCSKSRAGEKSRRLIDWTSAPYKTDIKVSKYQFLRFCHYWLSGSYILELWGKAKFWYNSISQTFACRIFHAFSLKAAHRLAEFEGCGRGGAVPGGGPHVLGGSGTRPPMTSTVRKSIIAISRAPMAHFQKSDGGGPPALDATSTKTSTTSTMSRVIADHPLLSNQTNDYLNMILSWLEE